MTDEATKEKVYAMLGRYLAGDLEEHTGHIEGFYFPSWRKMKKYGWLTREAILII